MKMYMDGWMDGWVEPASPCKRSARAGEVTSSCLRCNMTERDAEIKRSMDEWMDGWMDALFSELAALLFPPSR